MLKRSWKLVVLYSTLDPHVYYLDYEMYSLDRVIDAAEMMMRERGAINYLVEEVWVAET
jgi:hypothetical protein